MTDNGFRDWCCDWCGDDRGSHAPDCGYYPQRKMPSRWFYGLVIVLSLSLAVAVAMALLNGVQP